MSSFFFRIICIFLSSFEFVFIQGFFVPNMVENGSVVMEFVKISSMHCHYFVIISAWKRAGPFIWTNLNPLYTRVLCIMVGSSMPSVSEGNDENVNSIETDRWRDGRRTTGDQKWLLEMSRNVMCCIKQG